LATKKIDRVFYNTPLWGYTAKCTWLIKAPPKNPVEKNGSMEKECTAHTSYAAFVGSLKTSSEKTQWENITKEKRVQQLISGIIMSSPRYHIMGYG
jgi:hypothetical protein